MSIDPTSNGNSIALTFLNDFEARTVEAIAERIIPGGDGYSGAIDAGVVYYIDRAIAGFSISLQKVYRLGLRELDRFCHRRYSASFVDLDATRQDETVRRFLGPETAEGAAERISAPDAEDEFGGAPAHPAHGSDNAASAPVDRAILVRLFAVVREHAIEGMFCDPVYGGNRNAVGWRLVGFPGVHWGYSAEQMKEGYDGRQLPVRTLSDLRRDLKDRPEKSFSPRNDRL